MISMHSIVIIMLTIAQQKSQCSTTFLRCSYIYSQISHFRRSKTKLTFKGEKHMTNWLRLAVKLVTTFNLLLQIGAVILQNYNRLLRVKHLFMLKKFSLYLRESKLTALPTLCFFSLFFHLIFNLFFRPQHITLSVWITFSLRSDSFLFGLKKFW